MRRIVEVFLKLLSLVVIWLSMLYGCSYYPKAKEWYYAVLLMPLISIFMFGCYCLILLIYRVATIRDCPEAYIELQKEIEEARAELEKIGIKVGEKKDN